MSEKNSDKKIMSDVQLNARQLIACSKYNALMDHIYNSKVAQRPRGLVIPSIGKEQEHSLLIS